MEQIKETQTDKNGRVIVIYSNDPQEQFGQIKAAKDKGYDVLLMGHIIDNHWIQQLEGKLDNVSFVRVDSSSVDKLIETDDETAASVLSGSQEEEVKDIFKSVIGEATMAHVEVEAMSPDSPAIQIVRPEQMRRFAEMQRLSGMDMGGFPDAFTVLVNGNNTLINEILLNKASVEEKNEVAGYLYDLARLQQNLLKGEELSSFISKSIDKLK